MSSQVWFLYVTISNSWWTFQPEFFPFLSFLFVDRFIHTFVPYPHFPNPAPLTDMALSRWSFSLTRLRRIVFYCGSQVATASRYISCIYSSYLYQMALLSLTENLVPWRIQFSHSVVSDSLRPHGLQHARPPCPSPTPRVYSNSCPLSRWCPPVISSLVVSFSSCLQSFPASESFQMSQFFTSGGQSIGVSASTSVLPMNT